MTATDETPMYYAVCGGSAIDERTTYVHIPDNDDILAVVCGGEQITTTWKDLFRLLKWACEQWGLHKIALDSSNCSSNCTDSERTSDELGRGTCRVMTIGEFNGEGTEYYDVCSNCGYEFDDDPLNYCPSCGRKVMSA